MPRYKRYYTCPYGDQYCDVRNYEDEWMCAKCLKDYLAKIEDNRPADIIT